MTARKAAAKAEPKATSESEPAEGDAAGETAEPEPDPEPEPEPAPEPESPSEAPASGLVRFIPSSNTTGTVTESGATFSLAPGVPVKMTAADAEALTAAGLGSVQGE